MEKNREWPGDEAMLKLLDKNAHFFYETTIDSGNKSHQFQRNTVGYEASLWPRYRRAQKIATVLTVMCLLTGVWK